MERVLPYSDSLLREAAVEWLIATDQVHVLGSLLSALTIVLADLCS